jgi:secondary thiamine-phosphate synthase enzyme
MLSPKNNIMNTVKDEGETTKIFRKELAISTHKRMEIQDITNIVTQVVEESRIVNGLVHLWVPHATAAIALNEHDTDLWDDILIVFERLAPMNGNYRHNAKYSWTASEQNAHAHILNCLIKPSVTVPLENGKMQLGTWQSVLFIEMDGSRTRQIQVQVIGE